MEIVGYVDFGDIGPLDETTSSGEAPLAFSLLRRVYETFGPRGQALCRRLAGLVRVPAMQNVTIPPCYLFPERLEGKRIVSFAQVQEVEFDYILIAYPFYEKFRNKLVRLGVRNSKILSLWAEQEKCLERLGEVRYFLGRRISYQDGKPRRCYHLWPLRGKIVNDVSCPVPLEDQRSLVKTLLRSCKAAIKDIRDASPLYRAGFNWNVVLRSTRGNLWDLVEREDVEAVTALLNSCLRNCLSEDMYGGEQAYLDFKHLSLQECGKRMKQCFDAWTYTLGVEPEIRELGLPPIGNPYGIDIAGATVWANCFYNHYRSVFVTRLLQGLQRPVVAEIGGGVGLFAYYLYKRTDSLCYLDFDLPENLLVESYYLSLAFPEKRILYYQDSTLELDRSVLEAYDIILMPNFMLPNLADSSADMFVNTVSLSEMDYETISAYLAEIGRTCMSYFYSENLADFNYSYKSYPSDFFPIPDDFEVIMTAASRWPHFSFFSRDHMYVETLYGRKPV